MPCRAMEFVSMERQRLTLFRVNWISQGDMAIGPLPLDISACYWLLNSVLWQQRSVSVSMATTVCHTCDGADGSGRLCNS